MFNRSKKPTSGKNPDPHNSETGPMAWNIPYACLFSPCSSHISNRSSLNANIHYRVFFGIMFALSIAEMVFTIDSFQYLQKKNKWYVLAFIIQE